MRFVLVGLMLLTGLAAGARAAEPEPFTLAYTKILSGDFLSVGNGSMRCPVAADNSPTTGEGNTPQACADAAKRVNNRVNDNFFIRAPTSARCSCTTGTYARTPASRRC